MSASKFSPCGTHSRFFQEADNKEIDTSFHGYLGNKLQIEEKAVFSVLQFGAIVPPLAPWKGIQRFVPGHHYHGTEAVGHLDFLSEKSDSILKGRERVKDFEDKLDAALARLIGSQKAPVLLFSGGVDSGILASRLASLGYSDALLLNYSFGENDQESLLAEAMAQHLGLKFERIIATDNTCACLSQPGKIYPQPFGDHSTVPTSDLASAIVERLSGEKRLIIDGTGADGAFGMNSKTVIWNRLMNIPVMVRKVVASFYHNYSWHRSGKLEYYTRIFQRSVDMPMLSAVLAQNPLAGKLYENFSSSEVYSLLERWINSFEGLSLSQKVVIADLMLTCANIFAQKGLPILEDAGHNVIYPFLDTEMVSAAVSWNPYLDPTQPKALLKKSLEKHIPTEMIYRPKSGFVDPKPPVFFKTDFIDYLYASTESSSPISFILKKKEIYKACDLLNKKTLLPPQVLNCVWAIVFTNRWYETA